MGSLSFLDPLPAQGTNKKGVIFMWDRISVVGNFLLTTTATNKSSTNQSEPYFNGFIGERFSDTCVRTQLSVVTDLRDNTTITTTSKSSGRVGSRHHYPHRLPELSPSLSTLIKN